MLFIPSKDETLVLPFEQLQVLHQLEKHINRTAGETDRLFNGRIKGNQFRICQKLKRPDNFIPIIIGTVESTSKGSIIFLKYRLLFSTKMFFVFWSVLLILLALFFGLRHEAYWYATLSIIIGIFNYVIVYLNFNKKVKISHEVLLKVLQ